MYTQRVSHPSGEWDVGLTTNTDTLMPNFNDPVMNPDDEGLNIIRNILDNEEPKFDRQAISRPNTHLWNIAIEAEMDACWYYGT
jgi:hypothetical protein